MANLPSDFTSRTNLSNLPLPTKFNIEISPEYLLPDKAKDAAVSYLSFLTPESTFFGTRKYCHPKMRFLISFCSKMVVHVKSEKTLEKLHKMAQIFQQIKKANQKILFITTKTSLSAPLAQMVSQTNHLFVSYRWPGGLLTNMEELIKRIQTLKNMCRQIEEKTIANLTKRERMIFLKKKYRLEKTWQGLVGMSALPDYIFVIDPVTEKNAVKEAQQMKIPVLAITKSSSNPDLFHAYIPANDNSITITEIFLKFLLTTWKTDEIPPIEMKKAGKQK